MEAIIFFLNYPIAEYLWITLSVRLIIGAINLEYVAFKSRVNKNGLKVKDKALVLQWFIQSIGFYRALFRSRWVFSYFGHSIEVFMSESVIFAVGDHNFLNCEATIFKKFYCGQIWLAFLLFLFDIVILWHYLRIYCAILLPTAYFSQS